tara:strand:- start:1104 stop:1703 length:600 start_codon:yes stop_codon:yes gene_type:complete
MSFRIEEKLAIDNNGILDFKKYLFHKSVEQIYKPRKIESLYFENNNYEMYNDSLEGLTPRKKIRVRNYPDTEDNKLYLETKISSVEGRYKTRKIINNSTFENLKKLGILDSQYGLCRPCIYVIYYREYFKVNDVRISIDNNISYKLYSKNYLQKDDSSIVEIKTSFKKDLDNLIEEFPFQKKRFSKYCNGIEKIVLNKL